MLLQINCNQTHKSCKQGMCLRETKQLLLKSAHCVRMGILVTMTFSLCFSLPVTCTLLRNYKNIFLICHLWHWAVFPCGWNWVTSLEKLFSCYESYNASCLYILLPKLFLPPEVWRCPKDFLLPGQCNRGLRSVVSAGTESLLQEMEEEYAALGR